jgi:hypothetical protein
LWVEQELNPGTKDAIFNIELFMGQYKSINTVVCGSFQELISQIVFHFSETSVIVVLNQKVLLLELSD